MSTNSSSVRGQKLWNEMGKFSGKSVSLFCVVLVSQQSKYESANPSRNKNALPVHRSVMLCYRNRLTVGCTCMCKRVEITVNVSRGWACWANTTEYNPITSMPTWCSKSTSVFMSALIRRSRSDGFVIITWSVWSGPGTELSRAREEEGSSVTVDRCGSIEWKQC